MGFGANALRDRALEAIEEAAVQCRSGPVQRTKAIRFALAYLWSYAGSPRSLFDDFWRALSKDDGGAAADRALVGIRHVVANQPIGNPSVQRPWQDDLLPQKRGVE